MKKKKRGIRRASAVIAFILLTSIAFLSAVFTLEMIDSQIYRNSQEETEADYRDWFLSGSRNFFGICKF